MENKSKKLTELCTPAEEKLRRQTGKPLHELSREEALHLIHELQRHRIDMEMQNEELRTVPEELEESSSKYADLYDFAPIGYFTFDKYGIILDVNLTGAELLGMERDSLIKKPFFLFIDNDDQDIFYLHRRKVLEEKTGQTCEIRLKRENGTQFHVRLESIAAQDSKGYYSQCRTAVSDISGYKLAGEKLKNHREQLMEMVKNLTYELQEVNRKVEKKITEQDQARAEIMRVGHLAYLGELVAGVAHEINSPVNGIINYAQILVNKYERGSLEQDIARRIIKEGEHISGIARNLLSFARGRKERIPIHIDEILSDALDLTRTQLLKDGINLKINISQDMPEIIVCPQQIEQVFLNVISNARYALNLKYPETDEDKILEIIGEKVTIDDRPYVRVIFHDRGNGIPSDISGMVMNPFFTTKPNGTGLGLSISDNIIRDHGGRIYIDSVEGEHTKAIIDLPARRE